MIVVVDSPDDSDYGRLPGSIRDERVRYFFNDQNRGANASRNRALGQVAHDSDMVIFLDDDDHLTPSALSTIAALAVDHPQEKWIVTNRTDPSGATKTTAPQSGVRYQYARDYLIGRRITGDATHAIKSELATSVRFPTLIKNGEEWVYFFQVGSRTPLWYADADTTLTDGYDPAGLNLRLRDRKEQLRTWLLLLVEGRQAGIAYSPYFWFYMMLRLVRVFVKNR